LKRTDTFGFSTHTVVYETDLTRPIGDWKEAWEKAKERAGATLRSGFDESQPIKRKQIRKKRTEAKQEKPKVTNKASDSMSLKCRFHDLRHSAVTRLLEAGIPYPVVASIMGWSASTAIRMAKAVWPHRTDGIA
jgi:integrase